MSRARPSVRTINRENIYYSTIAVCVGEISEGRPTIRLYTLQPPCHARLKDYVQAAAFFAVCVYYTVHAIPLEHVAGRFLRVRHGAHSELNGPEYFWCVFVCARFHSEGGSRWVFAHYTTTKQNGDSAGPSMDFL